jgi:formate dehydrogenase maturation protein FdhE
MNDMQEAKQDQEVQTYCPTTGVRVLEYGSKQFTISGLCVTWWHCSACTGWHIVTTKAHQEKEASRILPA